METIIDKIIGKMTEKVISLMINHILKSSEDFQNANLWEKAIEKACRATEGIYISFANYLKKSPAMQRYFMWLTSTKLVKLFAKESLIMKIKEHFTQNALHLECVLDRLFLVEMYGIRNLSIIGLGI